MKNYLIKSQIESLKKKRKELLFTLNYYTTLRRITEHAKIQYRDEIKQIEKMIAALKNILNDRNDP